MVQSNLNQTPAVSITKTSPMELIIALKPATPLDIVVMGAKNDLCEVKWQLKDNQKILDELRTSLQAMQKEVLNRNQKRTSKAVKATKDFNVSEHEYML
ncbi:hypothetical protein AaE_002228 [Aphanomyces astaci]|uniref:Uncharacterized protein n=1 Tax=Aphanomyces astaci TaxID=112090 RepID=A0A6A5AG08_APHAT|nr:hypothetical protein AaE_002228 [Aphanomyces astaci]